MSNVIIDKNKIDILANAISAKSGEPVTMTLDEMVEAVDGIETGGEEPNLQAKTYTVDSAGTETVTADSGYDGLSSVAVSVPQANPSVGFGGDFYTDNNVRKWRARGTAIVYNDEGYYEGYIGQGSYHSDWAVFNAVPANTSVTPTESSQTIGGSNYMMEGAVTVNAIPSNYVGSGITQRSSSDLSASGATVTVPSGYYSAQASKAVASGTAGTPTATKGSVSNHSISVTPSVTNATGYITGSTINGTAVTVSASELVSGSDTVTSNDTYDVTNLAELVVNVPSGGGSVTVTDVANATGTTCVITSGGSPTPPTPTGWETLFDGTTSLESDTPYPYFWISQLADVEIPVGSIWRVTFDSTPYTLTATSDAQYGGLLGNPMYKEEQDDGSGVPFCLFHTPWGAWSGGADAQAGNHYLKVERSTSE